MTSKLEDLRHIQDPSSIIHQCCSNEEVPNEKVYMDLNALRFAVEIRYLIPT
jgi:hypothetical protein